MGATVTAGYLTKGYIDDREAERRITRLKQRAETRKILREDAQRELDSLEEEWGDLDLESFKDMFTWDDLPEMDEELQDIIIQILRIREEKS